MERDRKSTRLNSSHTVIYTLSLHDALPISADTSSEPHSAIVSASSFAATYDPSDSAEVGGADGKRSEEHTSELQSHRDLHSFPTRRSSDLRRHIVGAAFRDSERKQFCRHIRSLGLRRGRGCGWKGRAIPGNEICVYRIVERGKVDAR